MVVAQDWQRRLQSGEAKSRANLDRQLGVSRPHVTQVLRLLSISQEVKGAILALGNPMEGRIVGAHTLRGLAKLPAQEQQHEIARLLSSNGP